MMFEGSGTGIGNGIAVNGAENELGNNFNSNVSLVNLKNLYK